MADAFVIGRRLRLPATLGVACVMLALAFVAFAALTHWWWVIALGVPFVLLGTVQFSGVRDTAPLLVADEHGVRLQADGAWVGLLWRELGDIRVQPRVGTREPHVVVASADGERTISVPMGLGTDGKIKTVEAELARRRASAAY